MKGIVWSDMYYMLVVFLTMVIVLVRAVQVVGGWGELWAANVRADRILFDDFRPDPGVRHSVWSVLLGGFFTFSSILAVNPPRVQKVVSCSTPRDAQIAMYLASMLFILATWLCILNGLYMGAFYENCDPFFVHLIDSGVQLLPLFAADILADSYGMVGFVGAGIYSGCLSTIASEMSAVSASILEDFIGSYHIYTISEQTARLLSQLIVLVVGLLGIVGVFVLSQIGDVVSLAISMFGVTASPVLGAFSLGMFFPWTNTK
ncbi:hypothetical protein EGW08_001939, partial [Elysia chlorotica]